MSVAALAPILAAFATSIPGTTASKICAGTGIPYPQAALAATSHHVWAACRDAGLLERLSVRTGRVTKTVRLPRIHPWALAAGYGSLWSIDREQTTLLRLDPDTGRVRRRIAVPGLPVYVWAGAGSIWLGLENGSDVVRVDPVSSRVRLVDAGDGASGFAWDGASVWIVSHRDNALTRVDVGSGVSTTVATGIAPIDTAAAERIAFAGGSLWITGRGLDLLRVDPASGTVTGTTDIGPAGIDVLALGSRLVVSAATSRGARRGDPILGALLTVDARTGQVSSTTPASASMFTNGIVVRGDTAWTGDIVHGVVTRVAIGRATGRARRLSRSNGGRSSARTPWPLGVVRRAPRGPSARARSGSAASR
jgi:streptogramin lyase